LNQKVEPDNILYDVSRKTQLSQGESILSIGKAYLDLLEIQTAIKCFERARSIGQLQNYEGLVAKADAHIGLAYCKSSQYELENSNSKNNY